MADFQCTECGLKAHSKCPSRRSVFPESGDVARLSNMFWAEQEVEDGILLSGDAADVHKLTVTFRNILLTDEVDDTLDRFLEIMRDTEEEVLRQVFCHHKWEILEGECLFGCHTASDSDTEN